MGLFDCFKTKDEVAEELASVLVDEWEADGRDMTEDQRSDYLECTKMYLCEKYDKSIMVADLDAFYR